MLRVLLSVAVVLAGAGRVPADEAAADLKKLVGTWEEVSHTADGQAKPAAELKGHTVVIDAAGKWEAFKDGVSLLKGSVKLDPTRKPRAADWTIDGADVVVPGIYAVDGDTWKHCFSVKGRPAAFESKEGSEVTYIVLKRARK